MQKSNACAARLPPGRSTLTQRRRGEERHKNSSEIGNIGSARLGSIRGHIHTYITRPCLSQKFQLERKFMLGTPSDIDEARTVNTLPMSKCVNFGTKEWRRHFISFQKQADHHLDYRERKAPSGSSRKEPSKVLSQSWAHLYQAG